MPHVTTNIPPCELLMNRRLKTRFDLLRPDLESNVVKKQEAQSRNYKGKSNANSNLDEGDYMFYKKLDLYTSQLHPAN